MAWTGFPELNKSRASYAMEKTHSDLWGLYKVQSLQGSSCFISFTDDFSRKITVKFLKLKSETEREVKNYISSIQTQLGKTPKAFKVDHATEYLKRDLVQCLQGRGIELEVTAPYSHQQHGTSECGNCTLLDLARAMLLEKKLPTFLWEEAIRHTAYIQNWSVTQVLDASTPEEAWSGTRPNVSHLREFGSPVWVFDEQR